jgi:hypothetical protein
VPPQHDRICAERVHSHGQESTRRAQPWSSDRHGIAIEPYSVIDEQKAVALVMPKCSGDAVSATDGRRQGRERRRRRSAQSSRRLGNLHTFQTYTPPTEHPEPHHRSNRAQQPSPPPERALRLRRYASSSLSRSTAVCELLLLARVVRASSSCGSG